ncbi:MAG: 30S ribosomal protein S9 [SAR202 cluster bacterium]|nr:30S ribosomal protein S9 [Dehalococcoidia bacterium]MDP7626352.1 30S ribosomal protein S9 [SAR202 cluster bacterium]PKB66300.1 MAG: 30S ribosomal protein S9 [SAR202 cluster bacterium Io17-Chloro-G3]MCS5659828.1 30S ribosomal protein S9 [Dehalococcoidia bacterium]MQG03095.1 30S ribosomal protein S9 [SAR202 cluster bacterium]
MVEQAYTYAVGRRKTAVAQVRLYSDAGPVVVDDRLMEEAFPYSIWQQIINEPFTVTSTQGRFRVVAKLSGGGVNGRAGALRHGIARALAEVENGKFRGDLKRAGLLTRDARVKERKKPGLKRARKAKQYTKR